MIFVLQVITTTSIVYFTPDFAMTAQTKSASSEEPAYVLMDRKTKGGRNLQYRLTVLQQPERARACGSGSKCE